MQIGLGPGVFDRQRDLASRAAAGDVAEIGYECDGIVVGEYTRSPECVGEELRSPAAQCRRVGGNRYTELVTGDPVIVGGHGGSPGLFGRAHQHVVDRHPAIASHHEQHRIGDILGPQFDHSGGLLLKRFSR